MASGGPPLNHREGCEGAFCGPRCKLPHGFAGRLLFQPGATGGLRASSILASLADSGKGGSTHHRFLRREMSSENPPFELLVATKFPCSSVMVAFAIAAFMGLAPFTTWAMEAGQPIDLGICVACSVGSRLRAGPWRWLSGARELRVGIMDFLN